MFDKDYALTGKHATYTKALVNEAKLYERYIDVYMNGAVFGLLHQRAVPRDTETHDRANILAEVFAKCRNDCMMLYRLVMLLETETDLEVPEKIDRAFRDDADEQGTEKLAANLDLFHSYVRGGIEEIYEQFIQGHGKTPEEYLQGAIEVMEEFKEDLEGKDFKDKLDAMM